ncbi:phosphonate C-P lyase system protein PhnH [Desulfonatronum thioautotrophicum]|uniref:phosphonate C-P lyase system protein PhnH n=1 Tax=Desulfonatronum thioautotrophicum TaxID=617001 RepID=UPI000699B83C|nr:phosphonate C-P lyase system protein PhnH [Desulfonatronum thioautotrophicum]
MNNLITVGAVSVGFSSPVHDAQATFRVLLEAMARPGKRLSLPIRPDVSHGLPEEAMSVLLTLADFDTPVWLSEYSRNTEIKDFLRFHCGCPVASHPYEARFGLLPAEVQPELLAKFNPGASEYPDRSATIVVVTDSLETGNGAVIQGPGVQGHAIIRVAGSLPRFWEFVAANNAKFPQGVDFIFVGNGDVACLPRSVMLKEVLCT